MQALGKGNSRLIYPTSSDTSYAHSESLPDFQCLVQLCPDITVRLSKKFHYHVH